jgi:hypothetical protein
MDANCMDVLDGALEAGKYQGMTAAFFNAQPSL